MLNSTNTTLAGYPAQEHVFTAVTNGVTMQGTLELTIANNTGYALEYVATAGVYPDYGATANNMTPSFYIIK